MHEISLWLLEEGEGYYSVVVPLAFLCLDSSSPNGGKPLCSSVHRSCSTNVRKDEREEQSKKVTLLIGHDDGFYRKVVGDIIGKRAFYFFIFLHSGQKKISDLYKVL